MRPMAKTPSYRGLEPSSKAASQAARGASRKTGTRCELTLRRALWHRGLRYRKNVSFLPGKPDIAFIGTRVAVFCDGDFWHGKNWSNRRQKLSRGANPSYWVAKIERNMQRDATNTAALEHMGWRVLRFWESDIQSDLDGVVSQIAEVVRDTGGGRRHTRRQKRNTAALPATAKS